MCRELKGSRFLNKEKKKTTKVKDLPILVTVVGSITRNSTQLLAIAAQGLWRKLILQNNSEKRSFKI